MTLWTAINLGLAAPAFLNPAAVMASAPATSKTADRTTTTVDATIRTVDRS